MPSACPVKSATPAHALTLASWSSVGGMMAARAVAIATQSCVHSTARVAAAPVMASVSVAGFFSQSDSLTSVSIMPIACDVKSATSVHALTASVCVSVGGASRVSAFAIATHSAAASVASVSTATSIWSVSVTGFLSQSANLTSVSIVEDNALATAPAPSESLLTASTVACSNVAPTGPH